MTDRTARPREEGHKSTTKTALVDSRKIGENGCVDGLKGKGKALMSLVRSEPEARKQRESGK
jgi:hypothetical protein